MGSCISTCRPKTADHKEHNLVQDKLVISQALTTAPSTSPLKKQFLSPSDSPSSSSFSCTTSTTSSSSCSSLTTASSCPSSILISKDRSFSNEFLWSCIKENPHIVLVDPKKVSPIETVPVKYPSRRLESQPKSVVTPSKRGIKPGPIVASTTQKRTRASSPIVTRQKSFRREPERPHSVSSLPSRTLLGSPSPSRRFNKETCKQISTNSATTEEIRCRRPVGLKTNAGGGHVSVHSRKENLRPSSPSHKPIQPSSCLKKRETCTHHINPKEGENAGGDVLSSQDFNSLPVEDIDNPLISLDCFIFL